jgi:NADH dehydrogenase
MQHLVIIGGGFAGFWSAMSAVRQARELGKFEELKITLVTKDEFHSIRPRFYEGNLDGVRVPLKNYLDPLGIKLIIDEVAMIEPERGLITLGSSREKMTYDYLILAAGSALKANDIPGIEQTFSVDTFDDAATLDRHIRSLAAAGFSTQASRTFVVVGGGFTGLEAVTAMPQRVKALSPNEIPDFNFILVERSTKLASNYSVEAQQYILDQLKASRIHLLLGEELERIEAGKIILKTGRAIDADTVVWTTGLVASSLTTHFKGNRDNLGRLCVDNFLRLSAYDNVLIAGDVAKVLVDDQNYAMMSCQHAIPQGKFAGHNAVNLIFDRSLIPYSQPEYVTCLDLGFGSSLLTAGWERNVQMTGPEAKAMKDQIVTQWICPAQDVEETIKMSVPEIRA